MSVHGEMAEWSNAVDSKSIVLFTGTGSSNLPLSAIKTKRTPFSGVFFVLNLRKADLDTRGREFETQILGGRKNADGVAGKSRPAYVSFSELAHLPLSATKMKIRHRALFLF